MLPPHGALTVKNETFHSVSLAREMHYRIFLPQTYAQSDRRFPVLYLLHGIYGKFTDWDTQSHLRHYAQNLDLIIVMPDAGDSWYVNSATVPQNRYEDYIVKDLMQEVDGNYRTLAARESRAIAGVSMGGYGTLNFALKHPELFVFAGSISGAINAPTDLGPRQPDFQANLLQVFGPAGSATRTENDIFILLKHADVSRLPYIYLACGESDPFLPLNQQFAAQLLEEHARYESTRGRARMSGSFGIRPRRICCRRLCARLMRDRPERGFRLSWPTAEERETKAGPTCGRAKAPSPYNGKSRRRSRFGACLLSASYFGENFVSSCVREMPSAALR